VSEDDSAFVSGKLQQSPVVGSGQRSVLGSDYIEIRDLSPKSAEDTAVEILVG
jgi:hypothetical protein